MGTGERRTLLATESCSGPMSAALLCVAPAGIEPAMGPTPQEPMGVYGTANHGSGQPVAQMVQSGPESCTAPSTTAIGTSRCASLTSRGVPGHTTPLPCSCACIFVCMCLWCVTLLLTGCHAVSRARNRTWEDAPRPREAQPDLQPGWFGFAMVASTSNWAPLPLQARIATGLTATWARCP